MITPNTPLETVLELGAECDISGRCCRHGSGIVLTSEVVDLAKKFNMSEDEFKEKYLDEFENLNTSHFRLKQKKVEGRPHGPCVFLADNGKECSIHKIKPLHCRAVSCCSVHGEELSQWFMLKYFLDKENPESIKAYKQYLAVGGKTLKGGELKELLSKEQLSLLAKQAGSEKTNEQNNE